MYFGSVRFYKHIIYVLLFAVFLSALYGLWQVGDLIVNRYLTRPHDSSKNIQTDPDNSNNMDYGIVLPNIKDISDKPSGEADGVPKGNEQSTPGVKPIPTPTGTQIKYQALYPELYNEMPVIREHKEKTVYLTFDDGPSARTEEILDILKERNIKATFFVVSVNNNLDILKRMAEEGHTIGIHSHTHEYRDIYKNVDAFLDDFYTCYSKIYEAASVKPQIFRFPGGSINAYNRGIYQDIISEMLRRGFLYYDWNISTQDTDKHADKDHVLESVKSGFANQDSIIVLCHDNSNKKHTVEALPDIIDFFEEKGYTFDKLDNSVEPIVFSYPN